MRIFLNNFELNNPLNRVYIDEDLEGLEMPAIRSSRGNRAGSSGGYFGAQLFDVRRITINGRIFAVDIAEAKMKRRAIQEALPLYPETITMRIVEDDGQAYLIYCQVVDFKMPIKRYQGQSIFKIELEASDPVIYDDTAGGALTADIFKAIPGGFLFSSTTPQFGTTLFFSAGSPNTSITNPSELATYPVIVITGATTNPVITNRTTGQSFRLEGYTVAPGSITEIDMKAHTVKLNGGNAFAYAPSDVDWWPLVPGVNEIVFDSGSGADVSQAALTWRAGYRGI